MTRRPRPATGPRPSRPRKADGRAAECVPVAATDPLYILYTSGTTGEPKGVVRDNGGYMVALKWSMQNLYGVEPGEVYWAASDVGWVVGHSYIVYAPLLHGCTTVLYEGKPVGTPDAGAFWRVIAEHGVVDPLHRADGVPRHQEGGPGRQAPEELRPVRLPRPVPRRRAGRPRHRRLGRSASWACPVIDHWWQTETGWPIAGNPLGLGAAAGQARLADRADAGLRRAGARRGRQAGRRRTTMGTIAIRLPLPPGCLPTLWNADDRFRESYLAAFPGYYNTSDAGFVDEDGYVFVMGRTDDIINVAGHRLSTGGMEEVLASHPAVAECAVIGVKDALKGEVPLRLRGAEEPASTAPPADDRAGARRLVRDKIGPVAAFKLAITVARLPKTRSGKILRGTMKKIADGDAMDHAGDDRRPGDPRRDRRRAEGKGTWRLSGSGAVSPSPHAGEVDTRTVSRGG